MVHSRLVRHVINRFQSADRVPSHSYIPVHVVDCIHPPAVENNHRLLENEHHSLRD